MNASVEQKAKPLAGVARPEVVRPVTWGFGRNFLAGLSRTLTFSWFPDRLDPRDWMTAEPYVAPAARPAATRPDAEELWFDYVSDLGDSFRATYSVAYLLHGDLFVADAALLGGDVPAAGDDRSLALQSADDARRMPIGAFVFCGGDAAYSVADYNALCERLQAPNDLARNARAADAPVRDLFAIPGNHDWYDSLDGFNRAFRAPPAGSPPGLALAGFRPVQRASYVAIELPFEWRLWGIDSRDSTDVDFRQKEFFKLSGKRDRLILATSRPLIVYNELQSWAPKLLQELGLELAPKAGEVRCYLSGDSHHYARYPVPGGAVSVVSGLGGASLHPPPHAPGAVAPVSDLFPKLDEVRKAVTRRLVDPWHMIRHSGAWGIGAIVGGIIGAALASFEGELSRLLAGAGLLELGLPTPPAVGVPWVLCLGLLALVIAVVWFGYCSRAFKYQAPNGEGEARTGWSKVLRGVGLAASGAVLFGLAVLFSVMLSGGRSAPSVMLDLLTYAAVLALGPGLGPIALGQAHNVKTLSFARKARIVALGALSGTALFALLIFAMTRLLNLVALLPQVSALVSSSQADSFGGAAAYVAVTGIGALAGGVAGAIVAPVLLGWAVLLQYALGAHYALPGAFALIDDYVCFIRFRLRRLASGATDLTGFVIGARSVSRDALVEGRTPAPDDVRLIDVFQIQG